MIKRRGLIIFLIILIALIVLAVIIGLKYNFFKYRGINEIKNPEESTFNESNNLTDSLKNESEETPKANVSKKSGGGGGGGGSSRGSVPPATDKCIGITCEDGYVCDAGLCIVTKSICISAQENELCEGLDIAYVEGYNAECHSRYEIC